MNFKETYYNDIRPILTDWLTNSAATKSVSNLTLSLANRAQANLWAKKPWSNLVQTVSLNLNNGAVSLPDNFGRIVDIWADLTGQGTPSYFYYDGDSYEKGYQIDAGFSKNTGYNRVMTFYYAQQTPKMRYQKLLEDFIGAVPGNEVLPEYSFFPANLIILEAQKIGTLEKGNIKEWQAINSAFTELFKDFCSSALWVNSDPNFYLNDIYGNQVFVDSYSLDGESNNRSSILPNSFIGR